MLLQTDIWEFEYPVLNIILGIIFCILGFIIMRKNKFYKLETTDIRYGNNFKLFGGGFLLTIIGIAVFFKAIFIIF